MNFNYYVSLYLFNIIVALSLLLTHCTSAETRLFDSEPEVRVRIINTKNILLIDFDGSWQLGHGSETMEIANAKAVQFSICPQNKQITMILADTIRFNTDRISFIGNDENATISIADVPYGLGWWWEGKENRTYEGKIHLYVNNDDLFDVVVQLPLEEYLKGVVPYEIGGDSPLEALKAQAVAARCEAVIALRSGLYSGENHDLTSDVECQVFSGNRRRTPASDKAVELTRGIILTENGEPINAYYASNCGGVSELIKNVWFERVEYETYKVHNKDSKNRIDIDLSTESAAREWIFSSPHVLCNPDAGVELPLFSQQNFRWSRSFSVTDLTQMLSDDNDYGKITDIIPQKRGVSGRIYLADFVFENQTLQVKGELNIRQMWKPALRSANFVVDMEGDSITLHGAGWGHGVGMCQSGAISLAKQGYSYEFILKHYYTKASVTGMY